MPDGVGLGMAYFAPWMPIPLTSEVFSSDLVVSLSAKPSKFDRKGEGIDDQHQDIEPKRQEPGLPIWIEHDPIPADEWSVTHHYSSTDNEWLSPNTPPADAK